jgi:hypothetical protein
MEIILLAISGWTVTALLLAKAGLKLQRKFLSTFLFSFFLSPIAGLIYINIDSSGKSKKTKKGGPWSTWIRRAEEAQENEDYQSARDCYYHALKELQDPNGQAKFYYKKYILSKISEVKYALGLLENKKDKQVPFDIDTQKNYLRKSIGEYSDNEQNSKTG